MTQTNTIWTLFGAQVPFFVFLPVFAGMVFLFGLCWEYTFDTWLPYLGKENNIPFWACMLVGIVPYIGKLTIPVWAVTLFLFGFGILP